MSEVEVVSSKQPITVQLSDPILLKNGEKIEELTLQPPKAKHVAQMKPGDMSFGDVVNLASKLSGVSRAILEDMSLADLGKVGTALGEFA